MSDTSVIDYGRSVIKARKFIGEVEGEASVAWGDVTDKPAVIAAGADQAAARTAIGAAAVSHTHTGTQVTLTGYTAGSAGNVAATDNVNAAIAKLEARIAALESAG